MITSQEIAWLAGLFEGEGCFRLGRVSPTKKSSQIRLTLSMTDKDIVDRAALLMHAKVHSYQNKHITKNGEPAKRFYKFDLYGNKAIEWMLTLYKFMGERKRTDIKRSIAVWYVQDSRIIITTPNISAEMWNLIDA